MSNAPRSKAPDSTAATPSEGRRPDPSSSDAADVAADAPSDAGAELLLELLEAVDTAPALPERIQGVVVGRLLGLEGGARVSWAGAPGGVAARAMAALDARHVGGEVAILFEHGDRARPVILGAMEPRVGPPPAEEAVASPDGALRVEALADGRRVVVEAERELVLSCGKASITLTRAGKILIRGAYVSSHATGTQRIVGGTVQIN